MIYTFFNDYLSNERHLSVQTATKIMTTFAVGGIFGQIIGGYIGQKLYNYDNRTQPFLMSASTTIAILLVFYILNKENINHNLIGFYMMSFLSGFVVNINGPNVRSILQV
jgi:sugar phosphate permease